MLARMRDSRCHATVETIEKALAGNYRAEHLSRSNARMFRVCCKLRCASRAAWVMNVRRPEWEEQF